MACLAGGLLQLEATDGFLGGASTFPHQPAKGAAGFLVPYLLASLAVKLDGPPVEIVGVGGLCLGADALFSGSTGRHAAAGIPELTAPLVVSQGLAEIGSKAAPPLLGPPEGGAGSSSTGVAPLPVKSCCPSQIGLHPLPPCHQIAEGCAGGAILEPTTSPQPPQRLGLVPGSTARAIAVSLAEVQAARPMATLAGSIEQHRHLGDGTLAEPSGLDEQTQRAAGLGRSATTGAPKQGCGHASFWIQGTIRPTNVGEQPGDLPTMRALCLPVQVSLGEPLAGLEVASPTGTIKRRHQPTTSSRCWARSGVALTGLVASRHLSLGTGQIEGGHLWIQGLARRLHRRQRRPAP